MLKRTSISLVNNILSKNINWNILDIGCGYKAHKNATVIADIKDFSNLYKNKKTPSSIGTAFKMSTELVAAVAVGTIIGFILDKTFGTKPWLILLFFFVGVIAGIMNVFKTAKKMQR